MNPTLGSLGSLIIDDIRFLNGTERRNVVGGGGVFAIYGMRIWLQGKEAKQIGYVAQRGYDHPKNVDDALACLEINLVEKTHPDKHTTRGLNTFGPDDHRDFEYIHPIIRSTPDDFPDAWILSMKLVHIISSTERTIEIVSEWRKREKELNKKQSPTQFLWEPLPWACLPENYPAIIQAGQLVDIISPNHEEAAAFLNLTTQYDDTISLVEACGQRFAKDFPHATIVIRAGKHGAAVLNSSKSSSSSMTWVPPYWTSSEHIVDVVGAGNAFCGGFMAGWQLTKGNAIMATLYGSVSSSFVVEQVGVPVLSKDNQEETWNNGPSPRDRLLQLEQVCGFNAV
ncbi:Ribokinase-like protein [Halteromyces radiatus]|uniref:Ribokinase-like protein n=1 Tax=Halteromyces radiatus TaxID=101107 RepID=UPI00221ECBB3|nr:Ribokinase-like protein [Halteromyces radiatus]KAI8079769.1 Ribokinase-like protein [Halteromyces radiatus]